jgi:excisionase family DNA binding protein
MGVNSAIREIAVDVARRVVREELKQLESAFEANRAPHAGPEPLLTVDDVAGLCSVTPKTVQRWIVKGLLRATRKTGMREYRITRKDYEAFASGALARATPEPGEMDQETSRAFAAALAPKRRR